MPLSGAGLWASCVEPIPSALSQLSPCLPGLVPTVQQPTPKVGMAPAILDPGVNDSADHHGHFPRRPQTRCPGPTGKGLYGACSTRWILPSSMLILPAAISANHWRGHAGLGVPWGKPWPVTMIIGNSTNFSWSLFGTGQQRSQPCWPTNLANPAAFPGGPALLYAALIH